MKLSQITLQNFRCFIKQQIKLTPHQNVHVFVGDNGAGKSAILDGIARGLAPIAARFGKESGEKDRGDLDISFVSDSSLELITMRFLAPFLCVRLEADIKGQQIKWDSIRYRDNSKATKKLLREPVLGTKALYEALDQDVFTVAGGIGGEVPVFAYYGTSRGVIDLPKRQRDFDADLSRQSALHNALNPVARFKDAFVWFYNMERDELAQSKELKNFEHKLPVLEAVRKAIEAMLPEYSNPKITTQPLHFQLDRKNGDGTITELYAEQLSDGYRTMLALVMDFARRLAQANPKMENPLETEAILLIDEVELHLHPDWQQRIVPDLLRTFPNTQIILTTHSPQVLTSVHSECIQILRDGSLHSAPPGIYGAESKRALERVLEIDSRPKNERVQQLEKLHQLISKEDFVEAKILALTLDDAFEGQEPAIDQALASIENRLWEKEVGL